DVVNCDDVGVVEGGGGLGLLDKAPLALGVGDPFGRQNFDRHETIEVRVARLVDDAHAALPELFEDRVMRDCLTFHRVSLFIIPLRPSPQVLFRSAGRATAASSGTILLSPADYRSMSVCVSVNSRKTAFLEFITLGAARWSLPAGNKSTKPTHRSSTTPPLG